MTFISIAHHRLRWLLLSIFFARWHFLQEADGDKEHQGWRKLWQNLKTGVQ
jgi:hypothetical protein